MKLISVFSILLLSLLASASDFKGIFQVSNNVICLYFEDGYIQHPTLGQVPWVDGNAFIVPIDTIKISKNDSYSIISLNDSNFTFEVAPKFISRKTKGIDFLDKETPGKKYNYRVLGHWIYIQLDKSLKNKANYTVYFPGIAQNQDSVSFTYDEYENVSEVIHVNQVGYSTESNIKRGYVYLWMGERGNLSIDLNTSKSFYLVETETNEISFTGDVLLTRELTNAQPVTPFYKNDFSMSSVYTCDFSDFSIPGNYKLVVEGIGSSYPFIIGTNGYSDAYKTVLSGMFHHRSGIDRTSKYSKWIKPIEHKPGVNGFTIEYTRVRYMDGANNFSGLVSTATGEIFPTQKGSWMPDNVNDWGWGGYFDAGDYDRHSGHLAAAEHLLYAYEFRPQNFLDNDLNIPESGNGIPDILDEAKWGIDCFRRLQGPTGGICGGMEENEHPLPGENSITDSRTWYVYAEEPQATFRIATVNAQLAYCLEMAGYTTESDSLLRQAKRVYDWAKKSRDASKVKKNWQRASIWLYKYTGEKTYLDDFLQLYNSGVKDNFALFVYASLQDFEKDVKITQEILSRLKTQADNLVSEAVKHPTLLIPPANAGWQTLNFLSNVHTLIFTYQLTKDKKYLDYIYATCDYNLGSNPENLVYMTGLGEKHINEVFNMDSWYDGIDESIPGIVPYGLATEFVQDDKTAVWRPYLTYTSCYPDYTKWPSGELWFENRYLINCNEYTIGEVIGPAAGAYSFIAGDQFSGISDRSIKSLKLNYKNLDLTLGSTHRISAAISPYFVIKTKVNWQSLDTSICMVDTFGVIIAKKAGTTKIIAKSADGIFADTCTVNVISSGTNISINQTNPSISIYPCPVRDVLNIEIDNQEKAQDYNLSIISITGNFVLNKNLKLKSYDNELVSINIKHEKIKPGIYFLTISNESARIYSKKISVIY